MGRARQPVDLSAFEDAYGRHGPAVHAYLVRLTGDGWAADELCQETFVRYLARQRELAGMNGSLGAWLYRVATNLGIDRLRRRARAPLRAVGVPEASRDDAAARSDGDLAAAIEAEIARLEPELRATFLLRAHHGLSYRHVGEALGVSERAAKDRFRRTRERLARRLAHLVVEKE